MSKIIDVSMLVDNKTSLDEYIIRKVAQVDALCKEENEILAEKYGYFSAERKEKLNAMYNEVYRTSPFNFMQ